MDKKKKIIIIDKENIVNWNYLKNYMIDIYSSTINLFPKASNAYLFDLIIINNNSLFIEYFLNTTMKKISIPILLCNTNPDIVDKYIKYENVYFISKPYDLDTITKNIADIFKST